MTNKHTDETSKPYKPTGDNPKNAARLRPTASTTSMHQSGTGQRTLTEAERFHFDISGFLPLGTLLNSSQVEEACQSIDNPAVLPDGVTAVENELEIELRNIIEFGGDWNQAFAHPSLHSRMVELVWGDQVRLISSRALIRQAGVSGRITQGGRADSRRFGRYRAFVEGEFRCLMISVLIALDDTKAGEGAFGVIPASHKANFAHPYEKRPSEELSVLRLLNLAPGEAVLYSEALSYGLTSHRETKTRWLLYQFGPSYLLDWPGCSPTAMTREKAAADPVTASLLRTPYYH